jgi:hypothetical protein
LDTYLIAAIPGTPSVAAHLEENMAPRRRMVEGHQPTAFAHFPDLMRVIAFKSPTEGSFSNVNFSDLPGALILDAVREPYWLADALIHELLHNRLFFIIERDFALIVALAWPPEAIGEQIVRVLVAHLQASSGTVRAILEAFKKSVPTLAIYNLRHKGEPR